MPTLPKMRVPPMSGLPIRVRLSYKLEQPVHAATRLRKREIVLDAALKNDGGEFVRILIHEIFHFAWLRAGNPVRLSYEDLLVEEIRRHTRGELGWSAEWRKEALSRRDLSARSRRWREYCCESFCDTAAWMFSGLGRHAEFTLPAIQRARRRRWFKHNGFTSAISV